MARALWLRLRRWWSPAASAVPFSVHLSRALEDAAPFALRVDVLERRVRMQQLHNPQS
jgi:hypothetical protein